MNDDLRTPPGFDATVAGYRGLGYRPRYAHHPVVEHELFSQDVGHGAQPRARAGRTTHHVSPTSATPCTLGRAAS